MASLQQRTPAWHAARKGKLTASNIGAAIGLCPWTSRQQAFQRATGRDKFNGERFNKATGRDKAKVNTFRRILCGAGNDATRHGTTHESDGILAYTAHTGNLVDNTGLHVHPGATWLAGSPDGLIGTEGLLEVKCPYYFKKDGTRVHKEIPPHYYMQMNLCMEATNRAWCDYISWAPEGYAIYRVTRDRELHEMLMPHYLKFFAAIQREAVAAPPQSAADKEFIRESVRASMDKHISYNYWKNVDTTDTPPEPDEIEEPPPKRRRSELDNLADTHGYAVGTMGAHSGV